MNASTRLARPADLRRIQELNRDLFAHEMGRDPFLNPEWVMSEAGTDYFRSRIAGEDGVCFVAEEDGGIVGYVCGGIYQHEPWRPVKVVELENTYVLPESRGQGVGTALFAALREWAREQGAHRMSVEVYSANKAAVGFYAKCGFDEYVHTLEMEA